MLITVGFLLALCGLCQCLVERDDLRIYGTVSGGNFTYYSLSEKGPITLYLHSRRGDADLYVSQYLEWPSYDPSQYCLHSASCGLDVVDIPADFKRPVGIGIYGHPFHLESDYILELKQRHPDKYDPFLDESSSSRDYFDRHSADNAEEGDEEGDVNIRGGGIIISFLLTLAYISDIILEIFLL